MSVSVVVVVLVATIGLLMTTTMKLTNSRLPMLLPPLPPSVRRRLQLVACALRVQQPHDDDRSFIHSFNHSFIHSFAHPLIHPSRPEAAAHASYKKSQPPE
eukprot:GHVU01175791.1.p5 GENE.GHVU01175791.1~~GHVU01175791.1.p5  ORF type:complete len:101 (-),score=15.96 GHVU01175791.1:311-613(-)